MKIDQVASNIYYLDSRTFNFNYVSGVYLVVGDGITLIETSISLMVQHIFEAVRGIGYRPEDIKRSIVTHIHLDHAGAAGYLARCLPQMQVYVHERGARHLVDPSKLIKSAEMVYGNLEKINAIHGEILPVAYENVVPVLDTEIDIGSNLGLKLFEAPGHAPHHLCVFEPESGCLFAGEALGHFYPESQTLSPAIAPPGFDYDASKNTIEEIKRIQPHTLCFSQFGFHYDAAPVINESTRLLDACCEFVRTRLERGMPTKKIIEDLSLHISRNRGVSDTPVWEIFASIVLGFQTYLQRTGNMVSTP